MLRCYRFTTNLFVGEKKNPGPTLGNQAKAVAASPGGRRRSMPDLSLGSQRRKGWVVVMGLSWEPYGSPWESMRRLQVYLFTLHENKIKNQPRKCIVGVNGGEDVVFFPPFLLRNTPTIKNTAEKSLEGNKKTLRS